MAIKLDLDTRSVLDVVEENFERVGLKTFAERFIYTGEHNLSKEDLIIQFQKTIHEVNSGYCDIHVNGFLLVYERHFVHIIEGSEDTIHRHLRFLFSREEKWRKKLEEEANTDTDPETNEEESEEKKTHLNMFGRLKLLIVYHSIRTLLFKGWNALMVKPPTLISMLELGSPMAEHIEQLHICMDKIRKFCDIAQQDEKLTVERLRSVDPNMETIPEVHLLDFLLRSEYLLDLRHVVHLHRRVDDYLFYFECTWPLPTQYTPRLLYKLKIDDSFVEPLPVMPWEITKEVGEEEGGDEERSSSSSSD